MRNWTQPKCELPLSHFTQKETQGNVKGSQSEIYQMAFWNVVSKSQKLTSISGEEWDLRYRIQNFINILVLNRVK